MVSFTLSEGPPSFLLAEGSASRAGSTIPSLVDTSDPEPGIPLHRTFPPHFDNGRQPVRLGSPYQFGDGSGLVVGRGSSLTHQPLGTPRGPQCTPRPGPADGGETHPSPHRQHHSQGPYQQARGHSLTSPHGGGQGTLHMGGAPSSLHYSGVHYGGIQRPGGLAESHLHRPNGVEAAPHALQKNLQAIRHAPDGPLCESGEQSAAPFSIPVPMPGGRGNGCSTHALASGPALCVPSHRIDSEGYSQDHHRESGGDSASPLLAPQTMVCGLGDIICLPSMAPSNVGFLPLSGGGLPSRPPVDETDRLALERITLINRQVPQGAMDLILESRRPSTQRIYASTWRTFCQWCEREGCSPTDLSVGHLLGFLREGFDKGLALSTLKRQVAALSSVLARGDLSPLSQHPLIKRLLRGVSLRSPPVVHRYPTWDLTKVLESLTKAPYEPLRDCSIRHLTQKVAFLVAITSARRISELAALSVRKDLCLFFPDKVVLRLDPTFLTKVNSWYHRAQELTLPTFCSRPTHPLERKWHTLDVRRALRIYLKRSEAWRKSEALFVSYFPTSMGQKVSAAAVGRWIRAVIARAYDMSSLSRPRGITAHSTRSAAVSAAWSTQASLEDVCKAATWASPSSFIRHYKIDVFASAEAAFGRRVLQQVVPSSELGT